ncbi:hypothetical protein DF213_01925 [Dickeya dianthicola]|uniref:Uncharacterized protein n=1 Tax=Dickeya dianthicola TaxID=204039 RepID=A0AAX1CB71_9GAMM|nr:hypothetical protein DF213_01925 [Dickeya dianthicola]
MALGSARNPHVLRSRTTLTYYVYAPGYSLRSPVGPDKVLCPFNMRCMLSARLPVSKLAAPITPTGIGSNPSS